MRLFFDYFAELDGKTGGCGFAPNQRPVGV